MSENENGMIDQLKQRFDDLNTRKIRAEQDLKYAESQLRDLKSEAMERYGTDDVDELTEKLKQMEEENERKRNEYVQALDKIEDDLRAVEEHYADADSEGNE